MWSSPCRTTQWWYICYLFIWTYLYIAKTNYAEFPRFFFFLFLFVCLRYGYIFTSPRRTIQSLHVLLFVLLSVSAVTLYLHRHFEPCRVYIFHSLFLVCLSCEYNFTSPCRTLQSWHILLFVSAVKYIFTSPRQTMQSLRVLLLVLLSVSAMDISLHRHDEPYRVYMFYFLSVFAVNIFLHRLDELALLFVSAVNLFLHRHNELCSVNMFYFLSSCLFQLWIYLYIATMNNAEFTCFPFFLLSVSAMNISLHRHDEIYRVFMFYLLSACLSQW